MHFQQLLGKHAMTTLTFRRSFVINMYVYFYAFLKHFEKHVFVSSCVVDRLSVVCKQQRSDYVADFYTLRTVDIH